MTNLLQVSFCSKTSAMLIKTTVIFTKMQNTTFVNLGSCDFKKKYFHDELKFQNYVFMLADSLFFGQELFSTGHFWSELFGDLLVWGPSLFLEISKKKASLDHPIFWGYSYLVPLHYLHFLPPLIFKMKWQYILIVTQGNFSAPSAHF